MIIESMEDDPNTTRYIISIWIIVGVPRMTVRYTLLTASRTNAEFEPYEYHEGDEIVGIDVDIARAICDKLGYFLTITTCVAFA